MIVKRPTYLPGDREDFDRPYRNSYHRVLLKRPGFGRDIQPLIPSSVFEP